MNYSQLTFMMIFQTFGNHDFDFGSDILLNFATNVSFPLVCANLNTDHALKDTFTRSHVFTKANDVRVGVIGYLTTELPLLVDPSRSTK